jgi:hypothetical protein
MHVTIFTLTSILHWKFDEIGTKRLKIEKFKIISIFEEKVTKKNFTSIA